MARPAGTLTRVRTAAALPARAGVPGAPAGTPVDDQIRSLLVVALVGVAYFGTGELTVTLSDHWQVHPIWPPVGVAVAALLVFGRGVWPGIAAASFLLGLTQGFPAVFGTLAVQTLGPLAVARILEVRGFRLFLADIGDVLWLAVCGAVTMVPVAVTATAINAANGDIADGRWLFFGAQWWVGDTMGILLVTPLLLGAASWRRATWRWLDITVAVAAAVGTRLLFTGSLPLMFLVFPFTLWAALRFPPPAVAILNAVIAGIAIWTTAAGYGPFTDVAPATRLVLLESFNAAVAITSLVLSAAVTTAHRLAQENHRLHAEVRTQLEEVSASRSRIVESADRERRRVERDLHDGAQQRLVSLAYSLGLTRSRRPRGRDPEADAAFDSALEEVRLTLAELRSLASGIHPPLLTQEGLAAALESLAEQTILPVEVHASSGRFTPVIERAAYFVVSEALANVAKHARATTARVSVREDAGNLVVDVADDGIGGADPGGGSGLTGLVDRVSALEGRLEIDSRPGAGTRIRAVLPIGRSAS